MQSLLLNNNALNGTIPTELAAMTALFQLQLNNNALTGSIPTELANMTGMTDL